MKNLKELIINRKLVIILCIILISIVLCGACITAFIINSKIDSAKMKVTVNSIYAEDGTEINKIAGKEQKALTLATVNGKQYINKTNTVNLTLTGTDENYSSNSLTAANIVVKVGGNIVTPTTKTLGAPTNLSSGKGVEYPLTLSGISGDGALEIEVAKDTLTDKAVNKNILTKINLEITIDNSAPAVAFSPNGNTTYAKSQSTKVTVTDSGEVGVNTSTLKYQWTQSTSAPAESTFSTSFTNGGTITKSDGTGTNWYLWILSKDNVGNTIITRSNAFYLDNTVPTISSVQAGTMLNTDPTFANGTNTMVVYNNSGNGTVTNTRISMTTPTGSGYSMQIKTAGTASPGLGGYVQSTISKSGGVFIHRIIAKIPVGYSIQRASNSCGDGATHTWITSQAGTGDWKEYIYITKCGTSGTFSTFGHIYLSGTAATSSNPVTWYVAYSTIYDTTKWGTTNTAIFQATDSNSGIAGYGINQSSTTAPTYTPCTATTSLETQIQNITANGTYYLWVKDLAGNQTKQSFTVAYVDRTGPSVPAIIYNGGANTCTWKNNYNLTLTSTDSQSGVAYYEIDKGSDGTVDQTTGSNFVPSSGHHDHTTRFRAVDNVGNRSDWTTGQHIHMDTVVPTTSPTVTGRTTNSSGTVKGVISGSTANTSGTIYTNVAATYLAFSGGADATSGVGGYGYATSATGTKTSATGITFTANTSGTTYYIFTRDNAGNYSTVYTAVTVKLATLVLSPTNVTLDISGTKTQQLTPSGSNYGSVSSYVSSNSGIATVSSTGLITGIANGTCTITATGANGAPTATCSVTVQTSPSSVTIAPSGSYINKAMTTRQLTATILPTTANVNKTLTWTSNNTGIAGVNSTGLVTSGIDGTATITVRTANGKTGSTTVLVDKVLPVWEIDTGLEEDTEVPQINLKVNNNANKVVITSNIEDNIQIKTVQLYKDGNLYSEESVNAVTYSKDISLIEDGEYQFVAIDAFGNKTYKNLNLKILFLQNDQRTTVTGGWNGDYFRNITGTYPALPDISYGYTNGLLEIIANPTSSAWGRLGNWFTMNSIDLTQYTNLQTTTFMSENTTGREEIWLNEAVGKEEVVARYTVANRESNGGWVKSNVDISNINGPRRIMIGTNGNNTDKVYIYVAACYLYNIY